MARRARALLALLLLQHARRDARQRDGRLVTLPEQERSCWRTDEIRSGLALLDGLPSSQGYAEALRLQALIASEHARAATADATDWTAIAVRCAELEMATGSADVRLNRAVAVAEAHEPRSGLELLAGLDELLPDNHRAPSVRGELALRAGDAAAARTSFARAIELCRNDVEREHLERRLAAIAE